MLLGAVVATVSAVAAFGLGYFFGRRSTRSMWLVRPHSHTTLEKYPLPEQEFPTVSDAVFVRTNLPGSTSKME